MSAESSIEQASVLNQAQRVFDERSSVRGDHWRNSPIDLHLDQIENKVGRLRMISGMQRKPVDKDFDEAIDIINYAAFVARMIKEQINVKNTTV